MNRSSRTRESGNVIFYILIAIALLGALSFAVSQSFRGNASTLTKERARLLASEIIEYSNSLANAVGQLRLRGVAENELCFDDPQWGHNNYDYAACSSEKTWIFSINGGGIVWQTIPEDAVNPVSVGDNFWRFSQGAQVENIGSTGTEDSNVELFAWAMGLKDDVCKQINNMLGVTEPPDLIPSHGEMNSMLFNGTYAYDNFLATLNGPLSGKKAACYYSGADDANIYYRVLLAR